MTGLIPEDQSDRLSNIDQIRDLLFGSKIREYDQRLEQCQQRLTQVESDFSSFQQETQTHLTQLQNALMTELQSAKDGLEKQLKYLGLTTHEEMTQLQQDLETMNGQLGHQLDTVHQTLNTTFLKLTAELSGTKDKLEEDVQTLRTELLEQIEQYFLNLKEGKVSRTDLGEVLFELCLKVQGADFIPNLQEAVNNQVQTDFILPEHKQNSPIPHSQN